VTVPNADRAVIAPQKLTGYLLNMSHKRGTAKARLLLSFGYRPDSPQAFEADLRQQHLSLDVTRTSRNAWGRPRNRGADPHTCWQGCAVLLDLADRHRNRRAPIHYHVPEVAMPFDLYGDVILTRDVPEHGVRAGDVGAVLERHVVPGVSEEGYSVEFFDMTGNTVAVVTLSASAFRLPTPADRPAVRALSA